MAEPKSQKRPVHEPSAAVNLSSKKPKPQHSPLKTSVNDDIDIFFGFSIDDGAAEELSKLLESTPEATPISAEPPSRVRFVPYPYLVPQLEHFSSYITINGNEESCGSSFSDADSSFMASVDYRGVNIVDPVMLWGTRGGGAWNISSEEVAREGEGDKGSCGWAGDDGDVWDWNEVLIAAGFLAEQEGVFGSLERKVEEI